MKTPFDNKEITAHPLFKLGQELEKAIYQVLKAFNAKEIRLVSLSSYNRIFVFLFTRSVKTFLSIKALYQSGYGQDISTLLRSLLDNLISVQYILCDKKTAEEKAERFVDYKWVVFRRYISGENNRTPEDFEDILMKKLISRKDTVLEKIKIFKEKYRIKSDKALITWSGRSIRDMAKAADENLVKEYDNTFRLSSRFSHPSIIGDRAYIKYEDHDMTFNPFPAAAGVHINFQSAIEYMLAFLDTFNEIFSLNYNAQLKKLRQELNDIPPEKPKKLDEVTSASLDKKKIKLKFHLPS